MKLAEFFQKRKAQSEIKSRIVVDYLREWATLGMGSSRESDTIAYYELYCGPGRYQDGTASTALNVLEMAVASEDLRKRLATTFVDGSQDHISKLETEIQSIQGIEKLEQEPKTLVTEVDKEFAEIWDESGSVPALSFVDPFGFKGLSEYLIYVLLKDWACDCIFFLNYDAINRFFCKAEIYPHMRALFGKRRAEYLLDVLPDLGPEDREREIMAEMRLAMADVYARGYLKFRFKKVLSNRTSHYLIFVTKDQDSLDKMDHIMQRHSTGPKNEAPTYEYDPNLA